jgi:ATP-dependent Zn protease
LPATPLIFATPGINHAESSKPRRSLRRTAIHEAGHAVIGRVLGMRCGGASIVPDDGSAGHNIVADPWEILADRLTRTKMRDREMRSVLVDRILTFMAGAEAENVILGSRQGGDEDDRVQIRTMLIEADLAAERDPRMRAATRSLVRRHRKLIEHLAAALVE